MVALQVLDEGADPRIVIGDGADGATPQLTNGLEDPRRNSGAELYSMSGDASSVQRLTSKQAHDGYPSLSPDGQYIAFVWDRDNNPSLRCSGYLWGPGSQSYALGGPPSDWLSCRRTTISLRRWRNARSPTRFDASSTISTR